MCLHLGSLRQGRGAGRLGGAATQVLDSRGEGSWTPRASPREEPRSPSAAWTEELGGETSPRPWSSYLSKSFFKEAWWGRLKGGAAVGHGPAGWPRGRSRWPHLLSLSLIKQTSPSQVTCQHWVDARRGQYPPARSAVRARVGRGSAGPPGPPFRVPCAGGAHVPSWASPKQGSRGHLACGHKSRRRGRCGPGGRGWASRAVAGLSPCFSVSFRGHTESGPHGKN